MIGTITVHLLILFLQKHTQFRGGLATEGRVVGRRFWHGQAFRSLGLLFVTAAVLALLGGLIQINPVWVYGPYVPSAAASPAQPDWYVGWLEGALRLGPNWEPTILGVTIPSPFLPGIVAPAVIFGGIDLAVHRGSGGGDHREHHLQCRGMRRPDAIGSRLDRRRPDAGGRNDVLAVLLNVGVEDRRPRSAFRRPGGRRVLAYRVAVERRRPDGARDEAEAAGRPDGPLRSPSRRCRGRALPACPRPRPGRASRPLEVFRAAVIVGVVWGHTFALVRSRRRGATPQVRRRSRETARTPSSIRSRSSRPVLPHLAAVNRCADAWAVRVRFGFRWQWQIEYRGRVTVTGLPEARRDGRARGEPVHVCSPHRRHPLVLRAPSCSSATPSRSPTEFEFTSRSRDYGGQCRVLRRQPRQDDASSGRGRPTTRPGWGERRDAVGTSRRARPLTPVRPRGSGAGEVGGLVGWLTTTDHKRIALHHTGMMFSSAA